MAAEAGPTWSWARRLAMAFLLAACSGVAPATAPPGSPTHAAGVPATVGSTAPPSGAPGPGSTGAQPTGAEPTEVPPGASPIGPTERATVLRVVDGDTIVVDRGRGEERVRYIGVDTPETVDPGSPVGWMGPEASAANERLVEGRQVVLERDVSETDRYGRLLRYVWLEDPSHPTGWLFVNLELVALGFAQVVTYPPDVRYVDLYLAAQRIASEAGLGLWGDRAAPTPGDAETPEPGDTGTCDEAYPTVCIPPPPPDLDCGDISFRRFAVLPPDPHRFDGDQDGIGCES